MVEYSTSLLAAAPTPPASAGGSGRCRRFLAPLLLLAAVACTNPAAIEVRSPAGGDSGLVRAQRESREGQFAAAARSYETLADGARGRLRSGLLLRAAGEWLKAGDAERAGSLLEAAGNGYPAEDAALRAQVAADLALRRGEPEAALAELDAVPASLKQQAAPELLAVRSRTLFALDQPVAAISAAIEREGLLASAEEIRGNRQLIWDGLRNTRIASAPTGAGTNPVVAGWLALQGAAQAAGRNPFSARAVIDDWQTRYPGHPAGQFITQDVLPGLADDRGFPAQVALLLPLSGRQQAAGIAVRDGFLAAVLEQDPARRPNVRLYDTAQLGATSAYSQALADGAQLVVGPLTKEEVQAVADSGTVAVPTLALNTLPEEFLPPGFLFQFALDPEDEARQVARRALADGRTHGVVLVPANEWGQRVARAFAAEFAVAGGTLAGQSFYDPAARDYSLPITRALLIDQSRARANALASALGTRFEFEPRARGDVQFVFMAAQPLQGRSLRPALRFHLAQDLPVYATSDVFDPDSGANVDLDGIIFPDMPWVIHPGAAANELRLALSSQWAARARGRSRLYAFGFDAFRLVPVVRSAQPAGTPVGGLTGRLAIDLRGKVRRELEWARIENGRPRPLAGMTTGMAGP